MYEIVCSHVGAFVADCYMCSVRWHEGNSTLASLCTSIYAGGAHEQVWLDGEEEKGHTRTFASFTHMSQQAHIQSETQQLASQLRQGAMWRCSEGGHGSAVWCS